MAAIIGDYMPETTRFHDMIASAPLQHHRHPHHPHQQQQPPPDASSYRSSSRPRQDSFSSVQRARSSASDAVATQSQDQGDLDDSRRQSYGERAGVQHRRPSQAAQIPSPPATSSPAVPSGRSAPDDGSDAPMASDVTVPMAAAAFAHHSNTTSSSSAASSTRQLQQQPSPSSDEFTLVDTALTTQSSQQQQTVIHVRDLAHVRALAGRDGLGGAASGINSDSPLQQMKYDISGMPIGDIIEMVAALLTKITTTNDLQHDAMQRNVAHQQQANQSGEAGSPQISPMSHSVLAFHGKNVPAITILSYLSRIHKYCPTTFEVFLSLLVYFDRMTERVNDMVTRSEEARRHGAAQTHSRTSSLPPSQADVSMRDEDETDSDLADDDDDDEDMGGKVITAAAEHHVANGPSTYFVVDSFNIHRLIIAGVTCSSKFFSDVFYTNSRYAKVSSLFRFLSLLTVLTL
jgi:hypothetical protein